MFNLPPTNPTTPIPALLAATIALYLRTFRPLFVPAALITLVVSTASAVFLPELDPERPEMALAVLFALVIVAAVSTGALSVVLWRAALLHRGEAPSLTATLAMVLVFGPRCFAGAMAFVLLGSLSRLALPALALMVFLSVRTSLYVPAIVLEDRSIAGGFARSWRLVEGRWMRTFLLELIVAAPVVAVILGTEVLLAGSAVPLLVAVDVVATGVFVPFLSVFGLLLFEDYARASGGATPRELDDGPPTEGPPR